jgi:hypothetical protein
MNHCLKFVYAFLFFTNIELVRVRRRLVWVRRRSGACALAHLVMRRRVIGQARVRFSARHAREVFPTELRKWRGTSRMATDECTLCDSTISTNVPSNHLISSRRIISSQRAKSFVRAHFRFLFKISNLC